jgi:hypothetical protein
MNLQENPEIDHGVSTRIPPSMLDSTISKPIVPSSYGTADVVVLSNKLGKTQNIFLIIMYQSPNMN